MIESGPVDEPTPARSSTHLGSATEIAPGVFTLVAEPASVTIGIVAGRDGVLVVDTGSSPAQGAEIRRLAADLTGRPVLAAVATHAHFDHAFGLAAFADVPTFGHESLLEAIPGSAQVDVKATELGFEPGDLIVPSRPLVVAGAVDLGERRVEIAHLGRGHTEGDLLVVVPDADVVFAGDLLEEAEPPWYGPDSVPGEWAATLDGLIGLMTDTTRAVPGHGQPVDREFVFNQRGEIAAVAGEIARLAALGVSPEQAAEQGSWPFPVEHLREVLGVALSTGQGAAGPHGGPGGRRDLPLIS